MLKPLSRKLKCAYMGIVLGLAAAIVYLIFLIAHQSETSGRMTLIPISVLAPATSNH